MVLWPEQTSRVFPLISPIFLIALEIRSIGPLMKFVFTTACEGQDRLPDKLSKNNSGPL